VTLSHRGRVRLLLRHRPIEISSADKTRLRLSRHGDQQLNNALHTIALAQVRMPASRGRAYYDHKIGQGKTHRGDALPAPTTHRPRLANHDRRPTSRRWRIRKDKRERL
jgi:transposase